MGGGIHNSNDIATLVPPNSKYYIETVPENAGDVATLIFFVQLESVFSANKSIPFPRVSQQILDNILLRQKKKKKKTAAHFTLESKKLSRYG